MMHFPSVSDSPLFPKHFLTPWKMSQILPFPETFLDFHPPKFLMTFFLVINHKFRISPLFSLFQYISLLFPLHSSFPSHFPPYFRCFSTFPPCFTKIILSPLLLQIFPPLFKANSPTFYILYAYFFTLPTLTMSHLCITQCTYWTPLRPSSLIQSIIILSRIYNSTKHGNRPIDSTTTAHFTRHISTLQLH